MPWRDALVPCHGTLHRQRCSCPICHQKYCAFCTARPIPAANGTFAESAVRDGCTWCAGPIFPSSRENYRFHSIPAHRLALDFVEAGRGQELPAHQFFHPCEQDRKTHWKQYQRGNTRHPTLFKEIQLFLIEFNQITSVWKLENASDSLSSHLPGLTGRILKEHTWKLDNWTPSYQVDLKKPCAFSFPCWAHPWSHWW